MSADAQDAPQATGDGDGAAADPELSADHTQEAAAAPAEAEAEPGSTADETEEVPQARPAPKLCGICEKEEAKYKCPRCSLP